MTGISIIVPIYNEEGYITKSISNIVNGLKNSPFEKEIIIIESGSTDKSPYIADELARKYKEVKTFHQNKREGLGSAIKLGISKATKEFILWIDGDNPIDPKDIEKGLLEIQEYDILAGYRLTRREGIKRLIYSYCYNKIVNFLFQLNIKDVNFSYKMFRRKIFEDIFIKSKGSFFATEILVEAKRKNYKIKQMGVEYFPRNTGGSKLANLLTIWKILCELWMFLTTNKR